MDMSLLRAAVAALFLGSSGAVLASAGTVSVAGGDVRLTAPVAGDLRAAGGHVAVDQPVGGDATVAGGAVAIRAPIGNDLRSAAGDLAIDSTVGGELRAAGGQVTLGPAATVGRGAHIAGGAVRVDGRVDGNLDAKAQRITINGVVNGDVHAAADELQLGPHASVTGALAYASPHELARADGAQVAGAITRASAGLEMRRRGSAAHGAAWRGVVPMLGALVCAAVLLLVAPSFVNGASDRLRDSPGKALGAGLALLAIVPVLAILLLMSVLGIPVGVALLALYPVLMLLGLMAGILFVARRAPAFLKRDVPTTYGGQLGYFVLAMVFVALLATVPVAGALLLVALMLAGEGALVLEVLGRRRKDVPPAGALPAPA